MEDEEEMEEEQPKKTRKHSVHYTVNALPKNNKDKSRYVEHSDPCYAMFGRNLVRSLNFRILFSTEAVKVYDNNILELQTVSKIKKNKASMIARQKAYKIAEQTLLEHYIDVRDSLYASVNVLLKDLSEKDRKIFTLYYLDGKSALSISKETGYPIKFVREWIQNWEDNYFEPIEEN